MEDDITLQINVSPGDINYAELTVTALVNQHLNIKKRLLVVDCCRPQKTKILNPDIRFPKEKFEQDLEKIIIISKRLLAKNIVSEIYYVKPDDPIIDHLSKKYLRGLYKTTHGAGGMVNMSYWVGFDIPNTKYLLHYDGDIMLYQKPGFAWVNNAIKYMDADKNVVMAVPRLCPPITAAVDLPSTHEGRPTITYPEYWKNDWFSTRHFLWDRTKIEKYLPLVRGKVMFELLIRKYANRAFPIDPEILMHKSIGPRGGQRLVLRSPDAWIVHPMDKSETFLNNLPQIISLINEGKFPDEQRGYENMKLEPWIRYLNTINS